MRKLQSKFSSQFQPPLSHLFILTFCQSIYGLYDGLSLAARLHTIRQERHVPLTVKIGLDEWF